MSRKKSKNIDNNEDITELEDLEQEVKSINSNPGDYPQPLYQLKLDYFQEVMYATASETENFTIGSYVIVPTKYGNDIAKFCGIVKKPIYAAPEEVSVITRKATEEDLKLREEYKQKEAEAGIIFKEKVELNKLVMKFLGCHFLLIEPKIIFFFSADTRIDFRKLVKDLVAIFKIRVELRQIGVRDEARIVGGLGSCGRPFCCNCISDKQKSVTIKMAKEQNLSLNSSKISGQCGRLLCCLAYEHDWYAEAISTLPQEGTKIPYDETLFKIIEVNPLTKIITLLGDEGRILNIPAKRVIKNNNIWEII